jgi:hypothetical protein
MNVPGDQPVGIGRYLEMAIPAVLIVTGDAEKIVVLSGIE